jgi:O-antigen/teichoic acid export membrane protein
METNLKSFQTSRGAVLLIGSQGITLVAGFIVQVSLTRLLMPEFYGLYAVAVSVLTWFETLIGSSIGVVFVKSISEGSFPTQAMWRLLWRGYMPFWVGLWLIFSASSWLIATWLKDERLVSFLLVGGLEIPFLGILVATQSLLQGVRSYGWLSVLIATLALVRTFLMVAFVALFRSALWALAGNAISVLIAASLGLMMVRPFLKSDRPSESAPFSFAVKTGLPIVVISLLDQITLALDLWMVKRLMEPEVAGFYGASRVLIVALFAIVGGLGQAWFPAMCYELGRGERERAKALLREVMRVLTVGLLPFAVIVWVTAKPLTVLLFSQKFAPAAEPLRLLVIGASLFVLMGFMRGALIADNAVKSPLLLTVFMALSDFALCAWFIPQGGMKGAALATTLTSLLGCGMAVILTIRRFGNVVPMGTVVRCGIASFVIGGIVSVWSAQGAALVGQYLLLACLYGGLLIAFKELKAQDGHILRVVVADIFASVAAMLGRSEKSK